MTKPPFFVQQDNLSMKKKSNYFWKHLSKLLPLFMGIGNSTIHTNRYVLPELPDINKKRRFRIQQN